MKKGLNKLVLVIVIILVALAAGGFAFYNSGLSAPSKTDDSEIIVTVEKGSSAYSILNKLDENGLIKNKLCAKVYLKLSSPDTLQSNTYILNKGMNFKEILSIISKGDMKYVMQSKFTIIEGATYQKAAAAVAEALKIDTSEVIAKWSDKEFIKKIMGDYWFLTDHIFDEDLFCPLEGYLYPDTYFIVSDTADLEDVTKQILDNTATKFKEIENEMSKSDLNIHQLITLASVVEAESLYDEDKAKIAGVFINRINAHMPLQSDCTVLYALGEKRIKVTHADLKVESKYNTYKYVGIPVGPISNPSADTVLASINYEKHDYIYFFATKEGKVLYAKTLTEHNKNISENLWY